MKKNKSKFYVSMTDNFMSGWGKAEGKRNVFVIECDNNAQAQQIADHAKTRSEMTRVYIGFTRYPEKFGVLVSRRTYADMGGAWIENGGRITS